MATNQRKNGSSRGLVAGLVQQLSGASLSSEAVQQSPHDLALAADRLCAAGKLKSHSGEHRAALACYNRALPLQRRAFGEDSPEAARTLDAIGGCLAEMGESYPALVALKEALHIRQQLEAEGQDAARARGASIGSEGEAAPNHNHRNNGSDGSGSSLALDTVAEQENENAEDVAETMNRLWKLLHAVRVREEQAEAEMEARRERLKEGSSGAKSNRHVAASGGAQSGAGSMGTTQTQSSSRRRDSLGRTMANAHPRRDST